MRQPDPDAREIAVNVRFILARVGEDKNTRQYALALERELIDAVMSVPLFPLATTMADPPGRPIALVVDLEVRRADGRPCGPCGRAQHPDCWATDSIEVDGELYEECPCHCREEPMQPMQKERR